MGLGKLDTRKGIVLGAGLLAVHHQSRISISLCLWFKDHPIIGKGLHFTQADGLLRSGTFLPGRINGSKIFILRICDPVILLA